MKLKSIFLFTLLFTGLGSMAQTMEEREELPASCVTITSTLSADNAFEFKTEFACQVFNYGISITNDAGEAVYQTKDQTAVFDASELPAGTYAYTLVGTTGNTVEYQHVKKEGIIVVIK